MSRDPRYDVLFEQVRIGPKVLKNRFFQVPHCMGGGSEKPGFQAYHRGMKAEGGWAAVCTEYCSIDPRSDDMPRVSARLWDANDVRNLAAMCDRVHSFGALAGVELWHGGSHAANLETRSVPIGVTALPSDATPGNYARHADAADIRRLQHQYVAAAKRAEEAGFDIVYVYAAHVELPLQFLSPYYNKRTDKYGGPFENRARFWLETLELVREAVGDRCAIASRLSVDTLQGGEGVEVLKDGVRFVELADHLVDLWDLVIGSGTGSEWGQDAGPSRFFEENHEKPYTAPVKAGNHTDKPVVGVGRVTNPDTMVAIVKSGQYDLIGAARPSISDPFLPKKIEEGQLDDIRECIGCNQCIARWETGGTPLVCTQNATAGEEYRRGWHPERFSSARNRDKTVLVVGAGPAGMECAMVLGKRGMSAVHLIEAEPEIGGCVNWISRLGHSDGKPNLFRGSARGLGEWARIVNYRQIQLAKLRNVEVHTRSRLSEPDVREYGADIVVIATGCRFATDGVNPVTHRPIWGADATLDWQLTPDEVLRGEKTIGERVLVVENEHYFMGVSVAQKLAGAGHQVTLVTQFATVASYMDRTLEGPMMHRELHRLGVDLRTETLVERIDPGQVAVQNAWNPDDRHQLEIDTVVLCTARLPRSELYDALTISETRFPVYLIGDAAAPRMIVDAIFDGHRLGREIDSPDPATPLPFIRERRLWGDSSNRDYERVLHTGTGGEQMRPGDLAVNVR
jgi:dimethylamine/trimethylamine dehydrogenase